MLVTAAPAAAGFGELFYEECHSGRDVHPTCEDTPTATITGLGSGLNGPQSTLRASPDGDDVYAIAARTRRSPASPATRPTVS